jgi:hypothetical protein
MQGTTSTEKPLTRYHVIGREVVTQRPIEISDWEAPDVETAKKLAKEIGVEVSEIKPMNDRRPEARNAVDAMHLGEGAEEDAVAAGVY